MSCAYRACDRLRCTDCDFSVSSFDNVQWASNIDYLFLRNNMPDYERLKSKLRAKKGMFFFKLYLKKVPIAFIYLQWQWTNFPQIWADITVCKWSNYWKNLQHFVQNCSVAAERFHFTRQSSSHLSLIRQEECTTFSSFITYRRFTCVNS